MRILFWFTLLFSLPTQAYYTTLDTANLVKYDHYEAMGAAQFVTDGNSGLNVIGGFSGRLGVEDGYRFEFGLGETDIQAAGYYKWAPIPDTSKQPGLAILGGLSFASFEAGGEDVSDISIRVVPIASKHVVVSFGDLTPYASLPISIQSVDGETNVPLQLTVGTHLETLDLKKVTFLAEVSFDLSDAFTYFALAAVFDIDPDEGVSFD